MLFRSFIALTLAVSAIAQRAANTSICDVYTTALLKENTGANQLALVTLVVNTAVIGNYSSINVGIPVPGILNPNGFYNGTLVNLVPYFNGQYDTTNGGGSSGIKKNFLDGGGASPLLKSTAADDTSSNQYTLLNHLYQYFGVLLGCKASGFPAYTGKKSMYEVHKFMVIDEAEFAYFVTQVGLSAASFGVTTEDVTAVGNALAAVFGFSCSPPVNTVAAFSTRQSICTAMDCPLAHGSNCTAQPTYEKVFGNASISTTSSNANANGANGTTGSTETGSTGSGTTGSTGSGTTGSTGSGTTGSTGTTGTTSSDGQKIGFSIIAISFVAGIVTLLL